MEGFVFLLLSGGPFVACCVSSFASCSQVSYTHSSLCPCPCPRPISRSYHPSFPPLPIPLPLSFLLGHCVLSLFSSSRHHLFLSFTARDRRTNPRTTTLIPPRFPTIVLLPAPHARQDYRHSPHISPGPSRDMQSQASPHLTPANRTGSIPSCTTISAHGTRRTLHGTLGIDETDNPSCARVRLSGIEIGS